jgi:hypothetical protein
MFLSRNYRDQTDSVNVCFFWKNKILRCTGTAEVESWLIVAGMWWVSIERLIYLWNEARIRQDLPDITMENPAPMQVAGVPGVSFVQLQDPELGNRYEVWFAHGGTLYEAATHVPQHSRRSSAPEHFRLCW